MRTAIKPQTQECSGWELDFERAALAQYRERMGRNRSREERLADLAIINSRAPRITR